MNHLVFWILGFGTLWAGLTLFNDEVVLIVSLLLGSSFILAGLISSPPLLQIGIEVALVIALFRICMVCIQRGDPMQ